MNLLQSKIKEASQKYYTDGTSDLTDEEFDTLLEQERQLNPDSPLLKVGHGYDVNQDTTYGEKISHKYGLVGSLPKCKTLKEFISTFKNRDYSKDVVSSTKLDGLSVVCYFNNGIFTSAVTRGNGEIGIDITDKIKYITNLESTDEHTFTGGIRGEIVMSYENFEKFHIIHPESKNPRNSVAGLINNKGITSDLDYVDVVFYTIVGSENISFSSYSNILYWLLDNLPNQKVVQFELNSLDNYNSNSEHFIDEMEVLKTKWYGQYPCDGIVHTYDEIDVLDDTISYVSTAFKFEGEVKETIVTNIDWNLSKLGFLIPRINFDAIKLAGATIQWCTGHNADNIKSTKVGIGSRIRVTRSNEVIPYLKEVLSEEKYELPRSCPSCGTNLIWNGVHLQCPNRECKNTDIQDALIWMSNIAPVDGLGDTLKLKFLGELLGDNNISVEEIYKHGPIDMTYSPYVKQQLFNETFNRMFTDKIKLESAILALNLPRFGDITAKKLSKYPDEILKCYIDGHRVSKLHQLQYRNILKSIGNANYKSLEDNEYKMQRLNLIKDQIIWRDEFTTEFKGEVCITGRLSVKRSTFEEELQKAGYVAVDSVKKGTKYLITDNPNSGSSKNKNADKYGIPKVTEKEFRQRYM